MTPMDENELRRELAQVTVPQRDDSALTASVIARGRGIKRRRGIVAALAVALVAVGGIGLGVSLMPGETTAPATASPSPVPSTSPSQTQTPTVQSPSPTLPAPSASASPSPAAPAFTPVWTDPGKLPGQVGDLGGRALPLDSHEPAIAEESLEAQDTEVFCLQEPLTFPALTQLTGGHTMVLNAPTSVEWQTVLIFRDEASAVEFMAQLREQGQACLDAGITEPTVADGIAYRSVPTFRDLEDLGDEGTVLGGYSEVSHDDQRSWGLAPDASAGFWAREGNVVGAAFLGGEAAGDMAVNETVGKELLANLEQILEG